jgi:hypothetical protein
MYLHAFSIILCFSPYFLGGATVTELLESVITRLALDALRDLIDRLVH